MDLTKPAPTMTADRTAVLPATLPALVQVTAAADPAGAALLCGYRYMTYRELDERSDAVATAILAKLGVAHAREAVVGLQVQRGIDAFVGMLGIMKAGAAYLPFDLDLPRDRIAFMLKDSGAVLMLGSGAGDAPTTVPALDLAEAMAGVGQAEALPRIDTRDAAYLIYTSGSTGRPKGVLVEHRSAVNLALCHRQLFELEPGSRGLQFASLSFDASISETFSVLAAGAVLVIAQDHERRDPAALVDLLDREQVNVATLPPSLLPHLPTRALPDLQTVVVAGEVCREREMVRWAAGRRLINAYGPTEASVCATASVYRPGDSPTRIGGALAGVALHVLDETGQPVQGDAEGELHIAGIGVARGYLNRPDLTRERFVEDARFEGGRAFRTGDRVRWLEPDVLEFRGRLDEQIKIASYRIEPDEIARALEAVPGCRHACVVARDDEHGRRLVAFYVPDDPAPPARLIEEDVARWLPPYMLPAEYIALSAMPLTTSGKIDRTALAQMARPAPEQPPELTAMEEAVARLWREVLNVETIRSSDSFYALGGDSLRMTQLVLRLNQTFGTMLVANRFRKFANLGELAAFIERQAPASANPVGMVS